MRPVLLVPLLALATACGAPGSSTSATATSAATAATPVPTATALPPVPTSTPTPPTGGPHFDTPEAAMTYLADAWNRNDIVSLKHVTDPAARRQLVDMYSEARDLKLDHCTFTKSRGDYECFFLHGFPKDYKPEVPGATVGTAEFTVGPADKPGWYMTFFVDCGG
jgi:hypothetical protein